MVKEREQEIDKNEVSHRKEIESLTKEKLESQNEVRNISLANGRLA